MCVLARAAAFFATACTAGRPASQSEKTVIAGLTGSLLVCVVCFEEIFRRRSQSTPGACWTHSRLGGASLRSKKKTSSGRQRHTGEFGWGVNYEAKTVSKFLLLSFFFTFFPSHSSREELDCGMGLCSSNNSTTTTTIYALANW